MPKIIELKQLCWGIIQEESSSLCGAFAKHMMDRSLSWRGHFEYVDWVEFYRQGGLSFEVDEAEVVLYGIDKYLTVYLSNGADGWSSLFEGVVKAGSLTAWFFRSTVGRVSFPVYEMRYWRCGVIARHIRILKDGERWTYWSQGNRLPFEHETRYDEKAIGKRLDQALIETYSREVGFDVGTLFHIDAPVYHIVREKKVGVENSS